MNVAGAISVIRVDGHVLMASVNAHNNDILRSAHLSANDNLDCRENYNVTAVISSNHENGYTNHNYVIVLQSS